MDSWDTIKVSIAEIRLAMSAENLYFTAKKIGREPTALEAVIYFLQHKIPPNPQFFEVDGNPLFIG